MNYLKITNRRITPNESDPHLVYKECFPRPELRYDENQRRDDHGRFTSGGSSGLTSHEESVIISSGSDDVESESQRYRRNKNTLVDKTYIESEEYRRKFDRISENSNVNKALYNSSKEILFHRSGTEYEDMCWIDAQSGKIVAKEIDGDKIREINYSKNTIKIVDNYPEGQLITLHSHPSSMPPSVSDFNSAYRNGYKFGVVACHNGKVFVYKSEQEISERLYNLYIAENIDNGLDEYTSQYLALNKIKENHNIDFWEVQ